MMRGIDVVIPVYNQRARLERLLDQWPASPQGPGINFFIGDDASTDGVAAALAARHNVTVSRSEKRVGPAAARRLAWDAGTAEYVLALDSDACLAPGALTLLIADLDADAQQAAAGPVIRQPTGELHNAGAGVFRDGTTTLLPEPETKGMHEVFALCSAATLYRRSAVDRVGGFDPALWYFEDVDLCWRLRRLGFTIAVDSRCEAVHEWGATMGRNRGVRRVFREHYARRRLRYKNWSAPERRQLRREIFRCERSMLLWSAWRGATDLLATKGASVLYGDAWFFSWLKAWVEHRRGLIPAAGFKPDIILPFAEK